MFENKETLRKSDIVFGVILIAVSSLFLYLSRTMPTSVVRSRNPEVFSYTDPALVPSIVCGILIFLGICLIIGALREGTKLGKADFWAVINWCRSKGSQRMWIIIGLFCVYIFVMLGRLPYMISTFLFLTGFMFLFKATKWWKIILISAVATAVVVFAFGEFMMIPLP